MRSIGAPARIEARVADLRMAIDRTAHAGHGPGQPSQPSSVSFESGGDLRIEQDRARHRRRIRIAFAMFEAEDHQLQIDADLRRGQANAACGLHGLGFHVRDQRDAARAISNVFDPGWPATAATHVAHPRCRRRDHCLDFQWCSCTRQVGSSAEPIPRSTRNQRCRAFQSACRPLPLHFHPGEQPRLQPASPPTLPCAAISRTFGFHGGRDSDESAT